MKKAVTASILFFSLGAFAQSGKPFSFDGKQWWDYVKVLADDNMEGRQTGSEGEKRAQAYVVEQIKADGLQAAGTNGFYQEVPLLESKLDEGRSAFALVHDGTMQPLALGDDLVLSARLDGGEVRAPLVFVGYGLNVPEKKYNDLTGNLKGKVAVIFSGSPADMPTELASHYNLPPSDGRRLRRRAWSGSSRFQTPRPWTFPGSESRAIGCSRRCGLRI